MASTNNPTEDLKMISYAAWGRADEFKHQRAVNEILQLDPQVMAAVILRSIPFAECLDPTGTANRLFQAMEHYQQTEAYQLNGASPPTASTHSTTPVDLGQLG